MITSKIKKKFICNSRKKRVCQWDILMNVSLFIGHSSNKSEAKEYFFPYSVVFSQDCDLSEDYLQRKEISWNNDKFLETILICPAYGFESFCSWNHIDKQQMQIFSWKLIGKLKSNNEFKRFHYLESNDSFPDLVIDFKHFYAVPRDILYKNLKTTYVCSISELFRENISQRFTYFLWRIWLPNL